MYLNQVSCISDIHFQSFQYATSGHTTTQLTAAFLPFPKSLHDTKRTLLPKSHATWLPSVTGSDRGCQEFPRLSFPSGLPTRNWHVPVGAANSQSLSGCISSYTGHRLLPLKSPLNILNILDLSWKNSCNTILQSLGKKNKTKAKTNEQNPPTTKTTLPLSRKQYSERRIKMQLHLEYGKLHRTGITKQHIWL